MTNTVMEPGDTRDSSQEDPLEEGMATHSSIHFLPGESHGQRSLEGYSPWGCRESDMTDQLSMHRTHVYIICVYLMYKYIFRSNIWSNIESHYFAPSFPRWIVSESRGQPDVQGWSVASFPGKGLA